MNEFWTILSDNLLEVVSAAVVAIAGYIGVKLKGMIQTYLDDKTKRKVAITVVKAVNQMYDKCSGGYKLDEAIEAITEILSGKGISITELEVRMLIEEAVRELKVSMSN